MRRGDAPQPEASASARSNELDLGGAPSGIYSQHKHTQSVRDRHVATNYTLLRGLSACGCLWTHHRTLRRRAFFHSPPGNYKQPLRDTLVHQNVVRIVVRIAGVALTLRCSSAAAAAAAHPPRPMPRQRHHAHPQPDASQPSLSSARSAANTKSLSDQSPVNQAVVRIACVGTSLLTSSRSR